MVEYGDAPLSVICDPLDNNLLIFSLDPDHHFQNYFYAHGFKVYLQNRKSPSFGIV